MNINNQSLSAARQALQAATQNFLYTPNIDLIDMGYPEEGGELDSERLAVRFHVHQKLEGLALETAVANNLTEPIPSTINGVPTDVQEGVYRPQYASTYFWPWWPVAPPVVDQRRIVNDPLQGGISISNEYKNGYGTLGGAVRDRQTGDYMILSNWHVLVGDWNHRPNRRIFQPGRLDGGTAVDTIARMTRHAMSNDLDAAVARLEDGIGIINNQYEIGSVTGVGQAALGMWVTKSGRRTQVTDGRVTGVRGTATINYFGIRRQIRDVVTITEATPFGEVSAPGDSGSWWLNADTHEAVALHFAGSNYPERGLGMNMTAVLNSLNVEILL